MKSKNPENQQFYVYILFDPRSFGPFKFGEFQFELEPFYVGKGCRNRWKQHFSGKELTDKQSFKSRKVRSLLREDFKKESIVKIFKNNLTEKEAFDLETHLIVVIGRKNLGVGPLTNLTDGGEGESGQISYRRMTEETILNKIKTVWKNKFELSRIQIERRAPIQIYIKNIVCRKHLTVLNTTYRKLINNHANPCSNCYSESKSKKTKGKNNPNFGRTISEQTKERLRKFNCKYIYFLQNKSGRKEITNNLSLFCLNEGFRSSNLNAMITKKKNYKQVKGWTGFRIPILFNNS